jgi:hypothetical protein
MPSKTLRFSNLKITPNTPSHKDLIYFHSKMKNIFDFPLSMGQ